jgi:hypothetical protein
MNVFPLSEWTKLKYSEEENYFEESFNIESQFSIADIQYLIDYRMATNGVQFICDRRI